MRVLVTGATGMVGKGVLLECLENENVTSAVTIGRRKTGLDHPKLSEIEHPDFLDFTAVSDSLKDIDACYHCMGVSAAGMSDEDYTRMTYDFSMSLARTLYEHNPDITMIYVSGQGTDSKETSRQSWARIKGKTENDLLKMGFKQAFMFRPGGIIPTKGIQPSSQLYRRLIFWLGWMLRLMKLIAPNSIVNSDQIGRAMINVTQKGYEKQIIDPKDIIALANQ